jgi:aromatic-amino-acid transaminase
MDPAISQWRRLAAFVVERKVLPFFDAAFPGYGDGWDQDLASVRMFADAGIELLLATSLSKAFCLYNERAGALTVVGTDSESAEQVFQWLRRGARTTWSNPPAHAGMIVATILATPELRATWEREIASVLDRIQSNRRRFHDTLVSLGFSRDVSHVLRERGTFLRTTLTAEEVDAMREQHGIHMAGVGRINVTALTEDRMERFCRAMVDVVG